MAAVVNKFRAGILYSRALFVSENKYSYLAMNMNGSISMRSGNCVTTFFPKFLDMDMPIRKIGMDRNGIIRAYTDFKVQYPLRMEYDTYNFKGLDVRATLLDDCSFGVFDKSGNMVYRAGF